MNNAPKSITNHPAVLECNSGEAEGSDYKYEVILKSGWVFTCGRMATCESGFFNTVQAFLDAYPEPGTSRLELVK